MNPDSSLSWWCGKDRPAFYAELKAHKFPVDETNYRPKVWDLPTPSVRLARKEFGLPSPGYDEQEMAS